MRHYKGQRSDIPRRFLINGPFSFRLVQCAGLVVDEQTTFAYFCGKAKKNLTKKPFDHDQYFINKRLEKEFVFHIDLFTF